MDELFENFYGYEGFGPTFAKRDVPAKIERFRGKLPDQLLEYWKEYGWCGYTKGLLLFSTASEYRSWHDCVGTTMVFAAENPSERQ